MSVCMFVMKSNSGDFTLTLAFEELVSLYITCVYLSVLLRETLHTFVHRRVARI